MFDQRQLMVNRRRLRYNRQQTCQRGAEVHGYRSLAFCYFCTFAKRTARAPVLCIYIHFPPGVPSICLWQDVSAHVQEAFAADDNDEIDTAASWSANGLALPERRSKARAISG
uniref:Uncharacterized protein n=1 Tax=Eutreptiella gymnastica TaxID=73025 RepID=A0A7S4D3Z4_9EUGL|mmetsp:Transcript_77944/g.130093  ORF Transcript_77944/g.130093 Transcript_77944/m.130093 type:complete len:113 (-) Transcript_77944:543-881(-)